MFNFNLLRIEFFLIIKKFPEEIRVGFFFNLCRARSRNCFVIIFMSEVSISCSCLSNHNINERGVLIIQTD